MNLNLLFLVIGFLIGVLSLQASYKLYEFLSFVAIQKAQFFNFDPQEIKINFNNYILGSLIFIALFWGLTNPLVFAKSNLFLSFGAKQQVSFNVKETSDIEISGNKIICRSNAPFILCIYPQDEQSSLTSFKIISTENAGDVELNNNVEKIGSKSWILKSNRPTDGTSVTLEYQPSNPNVTYGIIPY